MTYKEVVLAIRGYENKQERELIRTRIIAYQIYCGIPTKGPKKPIHSYLPLPSDRIKRQPKQDMKEVRNRFLEKIRKQNEALN